MAGSPMSAWRHPQAPSQGRHPQGHRQGSRGHRDGLPAEAHRPSRTPCL